MNEVQMRLNGTSRKKTQATGKDLIKSRMRVGSRQDYRETIGEFLKPFEWEYSEIGMSELWAIFQKVSYHNRINSWILSHRIEIAGKNNWSLDNATWE